MEPTKNEMGNNHHVQKRNVLRHEEEPKSEKVQLNLKLLKIFNICACNRLIGKVRHKHTWHNCIFCTTCEFVVA